jgi:hypothetical protein
MGEGLNLMMSLKCYNYKREMATQLLRNCPWQSLSAGRSEANAIGVVVAIADWNRRPCLAMTANSVIEQLIEANRPSRGKDRKFGVRWCRPVYLRGLRHVDFSPKPSAASFWQLVNAHGLC